MRRNHTVPGASAGSLCDVVAAAAAHARRLGHGLRVCMDSGPSAREIAVVRDGANRSAALHAVSTARWLNWVSVSYALGIEESCRIYHRTAFPAMRASGP